MFQPTENKSGVPLHVRPLHAGGACSAAGPGAQQGERSHRDGVQSLKKLPWMAIGGDWKRQNS